MDTDMAVTIRALIERVSNGEGGETFAETARRHRALPLAEGWFAWALLTEQGEVLEASEDGTANPAKEPLRTMFLVAGAERYPELIPLLPVRSSVAVDCGRCAGTGRINFGSGKIRCHECGSLGWVEADSTFPTGRPGTK